MRKSKSKPKQEDSIGFKFKHHKHKKSVHEEVLSPDRIPRDSKRSTKSRNSDFDLRKSSRNSVRIEPRTHMHKLSSPAIKSPPSFTRTQYHTQYEPTPKVVKKRLTEYES